MLSQCYTYNNSVKSLTHSRRNRYAHMHAHKLILNADCPPPLQSVDASFKRGYIYTDATGAYVAPQNSTVTNTHTNTHTHTHIHTHTVRYTQTHTDEDTNKNTCRQNTHKHTHIHIHKQAHALAHTHTHTHTQSESSM